MHIEWQYARGVSKQDDPDITGHYGMCSVLFDSVSNRQLPKAERLGAKNRENAQQKFVSSRLTCTIWKDVVQQPGECPFM